MIQVRLSTTQERKNLVIDPTATPFSVLEAEDVVLDGATTSLNGVPLFYQDMNISFADLGVTESCTLSVVVKTGNA